MSAAVNSWGFSVRDANITIWKGPEGVTVRTQYSDGSFVTAAINDTPGDRARALDLGYRTPEGLPDLGAMTLEHDPMHSLYAEARGLVRSPTLYAVAHGCDGQHNETACPCHWAHYPREMQEREEGVILALCRALNDPSSVWDPHINHLRVEGRLHPLLARARKLLRER